MSRPVNTAELARSWVAIPSPSGAERAVLAAIEQVAQSCGLSVRRIAVDSERYDLLLGSEQPPRVLLTTHVDTVPGGPPPTLAGGVLGGRGACDAKGIAAAMLGALCDLRDRGTDRVALLLVVGEETTSDGARAAAGAMSPVAYLVNGEPTELRFVSAQRGALAFKLVAQGVACHSGYPELGRSAIHALLDALHRLRLEPWPGDPEIGATLLNVGSVGGGTAPNALADRAWAELMMRPAIAAAAVEGRVRELTGDAIEVEVRTRSDPQRFFVPPGRPAIVVGYSSDVAHLRPLGTPLMVGPGSIHVAHTDREQVSVAELEQARRLYAELCGELLQRDAAP
ncbi:MAG: M20/M25/M40 family metallo-hydrolase [Deltaproteobacteria bacterium]|nr:M20/M25/M40 family metallo-hydrolase [Deltaproteobacteria bacterium]